MFPTWRKDKKEIGVGLRKIFIQYLNQKRLGKVFHLHPLTGPITLEGQIFVVPSNFKPDLARLFFSITMILDDRADQGLKDSI